MKEILFKIKDDKFYITVPKQLTNKEFLDTFKTRMENLIILKDNICHNVILDIQDRSLNNREILQLFDILNDIEIFHLYKIICKNKARESISIYKGHLRGGQIRFFDKSILFIGNLNKGSKIIVSGDLYVLGNIRGDIELKNKDGKIYCESICNSLVKIADQYKLYSVQLYDKEISYSNGEIIEKDYTRGEKDYVKSDSCYIG